MEDESYTSKFAFNAIQQLIAETTPDGSVKTNNYNRLGLLERITVTFPDGTEKPIINDIEYNAKGQRVTIDYANGVKTSYSYENTTWRLIKLYSTRSDRDSKGKERKTVIQDIAYTYDPVGNITRLKDNTYQTVFYNNQIVEPLSDYTYDALYRLIQANGRQHPGINAGTYKNVDENGDFKQSKFIPLSDSNALENYRESYTYDDAGNLIKTTHTATNSWTRTQEIMPNSNRLKTVSSANGFIDSLPITYDRSGNQQQLNGNSTVKLTFNCCENLVQARIIERPELPDDSDYYTYNSDEMRTRKVSERLINGGAVIEKESKIYLGNYEVKRLQRNETTVLKRQTLKVMDDETCVAIFHYWEQPTQDGNNPPLTQPTPSPSLEGSRRGMKLRYQLDNHLGSVSLEVDDDAQIISYEEYFPYGGTAFIAGKNQKEVKLKEYRYSGKERDDATGLYYYGARYYAPWLGRWLKPDPAETVDGLNLYGFVGGNPINQRDIGGLSTDKKKARKANKEAGNADEGTKRASKRLSLRIDSSDRLVADGRPPFDSAAKKIGVKNGQEDRRHVVGWDDQIKPNTLKILNLIKEKSGEAKLKELLVTMYANYKLSRAPEESAPVEKHAKFSLTKLNSTPGNLNPEAASENQAIEQVRQQALRTKKTLGKKLQSKLPTVSDVKSIMKQGFSLSQKGTATTDFADKVRQITLQRIDQAETIEQLNDILHETLASTGIDLNKKDRSKEQTSFALKYIEKVTKAADPQENLTDEQRLDALFSLRHMPKN